MQNSEIGKTVQQLLNEASIVTMSVTAIDIQRFQDRKRRRKFSLKESNALESSNNLRE
jgi:hypothetical protein